MWNDIESAVFMKNARHLLAVTLVATAICADRSLPAVRVELANSHFAGRLIERLSVNFRRVVPAGQLYKPQRFGLPPMEMSAARPELDGRLRSRTAFAISIPIAPSGLLILPVCFFPISPPYSERVMHFSTPRDASASIPGKERGGDQLLMSYRRRATPHGIEAEASRRVGPFPGQRGVCKSA